MNATRSLTMATVLGMCLCAAAAPSADTYKQSDGIGRGFANLFAGWLEVPQCMTYFAVEWPGIGIVPGAIQGAGMTVIRTLGGVIDLFTVGFLHPDATVYNAMDEPMLPWEGPWIPVPEKDK